VGEGAGDNATVFGGGRGLGSGSCRGLGCFWSGFLRGWGGGWGGSSWCVVEDEVSELLDVFFLFDEDADGRTDGDIFGSIWVEDLGNIALVLHFEVNRSLVSLNCRNGVSSLNLVSLLDLPVLDASRLHGGREVGHRELLVFGVTREETDLGHEGLLVGGVLHCLQSLGSADGGGGVGEEEKGGLGDEALERFDFGQSLH